MDNEVHTDPDSTLQWLYNLVHKFACTKKMHFFAIRNLLFLSIDLKSTQNSRQFSCVTHQNRTSSSQFTTLMRSANYAN